jgi:hypothetical protein
MQKTPMVCVGREFWSGLFDWVQNVPLNVHQAVSKKDMELFTVVDTAQEAFEIVSTSQERTFF